MYGMDTGTLINSTGPLILTLTLLCVCLHVSVFVCLCMCVSMGVSVQSSRPCVCLLHHVEVLGKDRDGTEGFL